MLILRGLIAAICLAAIPFAFVHWLSLDSSFHSYEQPQNQYIEYSNTSPDETPNQHKITKTTGERLSAIWERTWDDPVAFYTFILSIFTALLAVVSATQIAFLFRADRTAKQSADVAQAALIIANRPWITVDVFPDKSVVKATGFNTGLKLTLNNTGRSPARRIQIRTEALYKPIDGAYFIERDKVVAEQRDDKTQSGLIVHPGIPVIRAVNARTPRDFLLGRLTEGNDYWSQTILICITYDFEATNQTYVSCFAVQSPQVKISKEKLMSMVGKPEDFTLMRDERYEFAD